MSSRTSHPVKRRTSRSRKAEIVTPPPLPAYARGNQLTHAVTFTDEHGTAWLVYLESAPSQPALWPNAAIIPGRRLRFDSLDCSVAASVVPAGAPFLDHNRLQALLDSAEPVQDPPEPEEPHRPAAEPGTVRVGNLGLGDPLVMLNCWNGRVLRLVAPAMGLVLALRDSLVSRRG